MIWSTLFLACFENSKVDVNPNEPDDQEIDSGEAADPASSFRPNEGQWKYDGGDLIPENTTCPDQGDSGSGVTDPSEFTLTHFDGGGFNMVSEENGMNCSLVLPDSQIPGNFICASSLQNVTIETDDEADVEMQIETEIEGYFSSETSIINTFTLTLTCLSVTWNGIDVSCSDIVDQLPSPCTVQFFANATWQSSN